MCMLGHGPEYWVCMPGHGTEYWVRMSGHGPEYWVRMPGHGPEYWVCRPIQDDIKKTCETLPMIFRIKHKLQVFKHKELKQIQ
jgi:hypothetical protein